MKSRRVVLLLAALALAAALLPASAVADDASVFAAYNGHGEELRAAEADYRRAVRNAKRSRRGATDAQLQAIIDADRRINGVLAKITGEVKGQAPSTPEGTKAKKYALRGLVLLQKANDLEAASYEQLLAGKNRTSAATYRRGVQTLKRAARAFKLANKTFAKLGLRT